MTVGGEFDGVARVIEQCLADARGITPQPGRQVVAVCLQAQALGSGFVSEYRHHVGTQPGRDNINRLQRHLAGFDL